MREIEWQAGSNSGLVVLQLLVWNLSFTADGGAAELAEILSFQQNVINIFFRNKNRRKHK